VSVYKSLNDDLRDAGDDEAMRHFLYYGESEGRRYRLDGYVM
jgi:hypothetical protein